MEINKIDKKYCTAEKVQLMLSNAPRQIIISKDGYLYLREKGINIHKYLEDNTRESMPYKDNPSSKDHATHLFKYNQVYVKFTKYRGMGRGLYPFEDSFSLTFLYFIKTKDGGAICAEMSRSDFKYYEEEETGKEMTREELEYFLYNTEEVKAKCIFEWFAGIEYAKHNKEHVSVFKGNFLDITDEGIIKAYNRLNEPVVLFDTTDKTKDESWKAKSLDDVKSFDLTRHGILSFYEPMLVVINDKDEVWLYEFRLLYVEKGEFKLEAKRKRITVNEKDIIGSAKLAPYTRDPEFGK